MSPAASPDADRAVGFFLPEHSARGRILRLGPLLNDILAAHAYPPPLARLLAEALVLTALLGAVHRPDGGTVTLQAQGERGPVRLLVADWREGALRGYLEQDKSVDLSRNSSLPALMGEGYLAITMDQPATGDRWQGIVALAGQTLAETAEGYFNQSDQLSTLVRLAALADARGSWNAGGLLLQQVARREVDTVRLHVEAEEAAVQARHWAHVAALGGSVRMGELVDPALPLETLLWRLFHEEEVRLIAEHGLARGCRCSRAHIEDVLSRFPAEERAAMRGADGTITVDCQFCSRQFLLNL